MRSWRQVVSVAVFISHVTDFRNLGPGIRSESAAPATAAVSNSLSTHQVVARVTFRY